MHKWIHKKLKSDDEMEVIPPAISSCELNKLNKILLPQETQWGHTLSYNSLENITIFKGDLFEVVFCLFVCLFV